jgi:hypothetical protein
MENKIKKRFFYEFCGVIMQAYGFLWTYAKQLILLINFFWKGQKMGIIKVYEGQNGNKNV